MILQKQHRDPAQRSLIEFRVGRSGDRLGSLLAKCEAAEGRVSIAMSELEPLLLRSYFSGGAMADRR